MAEATNNQEEVEANLKTGQIRIRGSDILGMINVAGLAVILYGGYMHLADAKDDNKAFVEAIKENTRAQREQVAQMREQNCLNRLTPQERERQRNIEFCRQLGKDVR